MAKIVPFRGVLYDQSHVPDISQVVAPPYDIIDSDRQRTLHDRHQYNVIRLELGLDQPGDDDTQNKYTRAAHRLREWQTRGVLERDSARAVYLYAIDYNVSVGGSMVSRTLRGFLTTVALEEFGSGAIFPHEDTRSAAKRDRYRLLESSRANFSPIFSLFSDPHNTVLGLLEKSTDLGRPRIDFHDDEGFRHRLWAVTDEAVLNEVITALQSKPLFIADGHHRYETALAYRRARRQHAVAPADSEPYDHVLMLVSSLENPGLTVLPTHRVLQLPVPPVDEIKRRLDEAFVIEDIPLGSKSKTAANTLVRHLRERGTTAPVFGLLPAGAEACLLLTLRPQHHEAGASARDQLDVSVLHRFVLERLCPTLDDQSILYTKDEQEAFDLVDRAQVGAALLLNPTKVTEVRAVAAAGDRMPHKSTYFFPKPLTGLVMNVFDEG